MATRRPSKAAVRAVAPAVLAFVLAAVVLPNAALAALGDNWTLWRPKGADQVTQPNRETPPGADPFFHGVYQSDPFVLITTNAAGQLRLYSDGAVRANLVAVAETPGAYTVIADTSNETLAAIQVDDPTCADPDPQNKLTCLRVTRATAGSGLPDGIYVQMKNRPPADNDQNLNSAFTGFPVNFDLSLRCYHLARMSIDDFQDSGCTQQVLATPPGNSKLYALKTVYLDKTVGIPYGWLYVSRTDAEGQRTATVMESGQDVVDSVENSIGFHASVNVFFFNASMHYNQTVKTKVENMYDHQLTYAQSDYVKTAFALVVDKTNLVLNKDFENDLKALATAVQPDYGAFVAQYGTHYAYATTFGMRGRMRSSMTRDEVMQLHETGTDISLGASAGIDIDGIGGSVGVDGKTATDHLQRMKSIMGKDALSFDCVGGDDCAEGHPSGATVVPILLDLRPLSDLAAPPHFTDEKTITTVRDGLARAIELAIFYNDEKTVRPAATFVRAGDDTSWQGARPRLLCGDDAITRPRTGAVPDRVRKCCGMASPIVTQLGFTGVKDVLTVTGRTPLKLGAGPLMPVPDAGTPFVQNARVEYIWPQERDSVNVTPGMMADLGMDLNAYCLAHGNAGVTNITGDGYGWRCTPSNSDLDLQQLCNEQHGAGLMPTLTTPPPGGPNDWVCRGRISPAWQTAGAAGVRPLSLPDRKPYDPTTAAGPVTVATALDWVGDGKDNCGGVNLDLTLTLQPVAARDLLLRDTDRGTPRTTRRR